MSTFTIATARFKWLRSLVAGCSHEDGYRAKIHASPAVDENALANATGGGSCTRPNQSRGLARRRNVYTVSAVGASSPMLLIFPGRGVALRELLVGTTIRAARR